MQLQLQLLAGVHAAGPCKAMASLWTVVDD